MLFVKIPFIVRKLFFFITTKINTPQKAIFLTFDDGPTPEVTEWVLTTLKKYNAKATFFCIGKNVVANPEIYKKIQEDGHTVGNHSYSHIKGLHKNNQEYLDDIDKSSLWINTNFYRPPYGQMTLKNYFYLRKKFKIIYWSVITHDWEKDLDTEKVLQELKSKIERGDIVLMHDSVKAFQNVKKILPPFLDYYHEQGFSFYSLENYV